MEKTGDPLIFAPSVFTFQNKFRRAFGQMTKALG